MKTGEKSAQSTRSRSTVQRNSKEIRALARTRFDPWVKNSRAENLLSNEILTQRCHAQFPALRLAYALCRKPKAEMVKMVERLWDDDTGGAMVETLENAEQLFDLLGSFIKEAQRRVTIAGAVAMLKKGPSMRSRKPG